MSLDTLLARQAGVVSREQALAAGLSRDAVDHHVRTRRWRPLHPCVYLAGGGRVDDEVRVRAAVLWAGPDAVLSGLAAAWWHGMVDAPPPAVTVTLGRRRRPRGRPGVAVRRRDLAAVDRAVIRGLAVTGRALSVLDAAVELGGGGDAFLDRLLRHGVAFAAVEAAYRRGLGTAGSATATRLLTAAADRSRPLAERELVAVLRRSGTTGWRRGALGEEDRKAVTFPEARVVVDAEGWARHVDPARIRREERRHDVLTRQGWRVLRVPWPDLVGSSERVLADIARAVGQ